MQIYHRGLFKFSSDLCIHVNVLQMNKDKGIFSALCNVLGRLCHSPFDQLTTVGWGRGGASEGTDWLVRWTPLAGDSGSAFLWIAFVGMLVVNYRLLSNNFRVSQMIRSCRELSYAF
jgi:hypothetical protein